MANKKPAEPRTAKVPTFGWDPQPLFGAGQPAFEVWTHVIGELAAEMTHFVQGRVQEDIAAWSKLAQCRNLGEAFGLQSDFAQKAMTDYFEEATKLSDLTMRAADQAFPPAHAERAPGSK